MHKFASVTLHPSLPDQSYQTDAARLWGVPQEHVYTDDVRGIAKTTNWGGKLGQRQELIAALKLVRGEPAAVFFATPLCVGFTPRHAVETFSEIWECRAGLFVYSMAQLFEPGDGVEALIELIERDKKAAAQRAWRAKQGGSKIV